jgi:hypothetical protein
MAVVPGVLIIGDYQVQGGDPGLTASWDSLAQTPLSYLRNREVMRITPDNTATGAPTASTLSCWPWYDGNAGDLLIVTASSATTATCTLGGGSPGWTTNEWAGRIFTVCNSTPFYGIGFERRAQVISNTANVLTFASGTVPTVGAIAFVGEGIFGDYHPVGGYLNTTELGQPSTRGGSSFQATGLGVGPDATLIRRLFADTYTTAPYFHCWKYATAVGVSVGWGDGGSIRTPFLAEKTRVDAAATARGNAIAWKHAVIDLSTADLEAAIVSPATILTYEAKLREMIDWLRTVVQDNADLPIYLVSHRNDLFATTGAGASPWLRAAHAAIVLDTANVTIVDLESTEPGTSGEFGTTEIVQYSQQGYFDYGEKVARAIRNQTLGVASTASGGFPVYILIGDSICTGPATTAWVTASVSPRITGPTIGSLLRPSNQKVWRRGTTSIEVFLPGTNSNTSGSTGFAAYSGPELSICAALGDIHPDGFALIKRGSNGSALATQLGAYAAPGDYGRWIKAADEHYPELQDDFAGCVQYINENYDKQADMRGMFAILGQNDQAASASVGGTAFAAALLPFVTNVWTDFSTRSSGTRFPIVWRQPQDETASVNATAIAEIRAALAELAETEPQFAVVDVDDLERDKTDNLHETPDSCVETGYRMVAAMQRIAI